MNIFDRLRITDFFCHYFYSLGLKCPDQAESTVPLKCIQKLYSEMYSVTVIGYCNYILQ